MTWQLPPQVTGHVNDLGRRAIMTSSEASCSRAMTSPRAAGGGDRCPAGRLDGCRIQRGSAGSRAAGGCGGVRAAER